MRSLEMKRSAIIKILFVFFTIVFCNFCKAENIIFKPTSQIVFPKVVIIDWDNTIINSWSGLLKAMNMTLKQIGKPEITMDQVKNLPSLPQEELNKLVFNENNKYINDTYWKNFNKVYSGKINPVEGVFEFIKFLKEKGVYVVIVSNKNSEQLRKMVKKTSINLYVNAVVGAGDTKKGKPDTSLVELALKDISITINPNNVQFDVWFIGDSLIDMICAYNCGFFPIWMKQSSSEKNINIKKNGDYPIFESNNFSDLLKKTKMLLEITNRSIE